MSSKSSNTHIFLANRIKISLAVFAIMAVLAGLARVSDYFYNITSTDIVYMDTVLPLVLNYVSSLSDVALMFIGYAAVAYYVISGGIRTAVLPFVLSAAAFLVSYLFVGALTLMMSRSVDILPLILYLLANYATECLRLFIVAVIAFVAAKTVRDEKPLAVHKFSPFATPFNITAFFAALIVILGRAAMEFFSYTLPLMEYLEISTIVTAYLLIIVAGVLGYFFAHLTTTLIARAAGVPAEAHNDI